jgi:tetratricopeptide (TPR) repeat protein
MQRFPPGTERQAPFTPHTRMDPSRRTLVGDATIPLSDVFQMLSMSQKDGTLIVSDEESRKSIYFGKDGIRLLASGRRRAPKLGDRLVRTGRITDAQLASMLEEQKATGRLFGEVAVATGVLTAEELQRFLTTQVEDELCDCFVWKYKHFEFYEGPPPEELLSQDQPVTKVTLNVNSILMEALRRRDEWLLIERRIPEDTLIYTWTESGVAQRPSIGVDPALAPILDRINGLNTVAEILAGTLLSAFDVYRLVFDLLQNTLIREITADEARTSGLRYAAEGQLDRAIPLLERAVKKAPDDPTTREAFAQTLAAAGRKAEAAEAWRQAAVRRLTSGQNEAAVNGLRQALLLAPETPSPRLNLVKTLLRMKQVEEACREAETFLRSPAAVDNADLVFALCETLLETIPTDVRFRLALARAHTRKGDAAQARAEIETTYKQFKPDAPLAARWYREMLEILPDYAEARKGLDRALMSASQRRRRVFLRRFLLVAPLVLLTAAGAWIYHESVVKDLYTSAAEESAKLRRQGIFQDARDALKRARETAVFTLLHRRILETEEALIEQDLSRILKEEKDRIQNAFVDLRQKMSDASVRAGAGDVEEAIAAYRAIAETARRLPPNDYEAEAKLHLAELETTLREARELREAADRLEQEGKYAEACRKIAALVRRFPTLRLARGSTFPLFVQSLPAGASVLVNDEATQRRTPSVVRVPLQGPIRLGLRLKGFEPVDDSIPDTTLGELPSPVELKKLYAWRRATGGAVESSPAVSGLLVLAGSSDGHVYAVRAADNTLAWEFKETGSGGEILAPVRTTDDAAYFASTDRQAYAVAMGPTPHLLWKYPTGAPLRTAPALDPAGPAVYVTGADRRLHAIDRQTGTALWTLDLDDVPGTPTVIRDLLVVGTASGTLVAIETATRKIRWLFKAGGAVTAAPVNAGDLVLAGAADGVLYVLNVRDGSKVWSYQTGAALTGSATVTGDQVLVGSRDKNLYALALKNGQLRWTFSRAGGPITAAPLVHAGVAYVGADDGVLHAVRVEDGQRLWSFKTDGPIRTTPAALGNRIFFGSGDRHLYALDTD